MLNHMASRMAAALLSGAAATFIATAPALAEEKPVVIYGETDTARSERVAFADLPLDTVTGRKRLHHRVGAAVERVCELEVGRDGLQLPGYYACAANAWGAAAPQILDAARQQKEAAMFGSSSAATAIVISAR